MTRAELRALPLDAFVGVDATTGRAIRGEAHLAQSVEDVLTTPLNAEVMDRAYGSKLMRRQDGPLTAGAGAAVVAGAAEALLAHEPRVDTRRVLTRAEPGHLQVELELARPAGSPDRGAVMGLGVRL